MNLPPLLVLTDRSLCGGPLPEAITVAVDCGARVVVLREKDLPWNERLQLADDLRAVLDPVGGVLVLAGPRGAAVHLSASDSLPTTRPSLVGRSCHSVDEVIQAGAEQCDYVTVSPVFATPSKPGYGPALGIDGLAPLSAIGPPVYALGGVRPADVSACLVGGAYGVAVMGPIMRDPRVVAEYLTALRGLPV